MLKMIMAVALAACVSTLVVLGTPASQAQTAVHKPVSPQVRAGQELFEKNCLQCHATTEGLTSLGPNLKGEMKPPKPKKTEAEVREQLKTGKNAMPSFAEKLSPTETDSVIAYLKTL